MDWFFTPGIGFSRVSLGGSSVIISDEDRLDLLTAQRNGAVITAGEDGYPVAVT
jgi:hypothetical protein